MNLAAPTTTSLPEQARAGTLRAVFRRIVLPVLGGAALAASPPSPGAEKDYVLKPMDSVRITVYQEDELTTEVRIAASGEITFPLIGTVKLAGKSTTEAVAEITARLRGDFLLDPSVSLNVTEYAAERITVMGEVQKPGPVHISGEITTDLFEAIAMAGGYTESADPSRITVRRRTGKEARVITIDGESLAKPFPVQRMDVVIVGEKRVEHITIMGEVQKPGVVELPDDRPLRLLEAIAIAGGYSDIADRARVLVRRRVGGEDKVYLINGKRLASDPQARSFHMQPNDVVTVAESFF